MSLITLSIWVGAIILFLSAGIALLPSGETYPFPDEIGTALATIWTWMYSLNNIFPVDTFAQVLAYGVLINLVVDYFFPSMMWVFRKIRGTDN